MVLLALSVAFAGALEKITASSSTRLIDCIRKVYRALHSDSIRMVRDVIKAIIVGA